jgi:hypothetical protein
VAVRLGPSGHGSDRILLGAVWRLVHGDQVRGIGRIER